MKNIPIRSLLLAVILGSMPAAATELRVDIVPEFNGSPLVFDAPAYETGDGQKVSVTRMDLLLSGISLRRADGVWIEQKNGFAYISGRDGKTNFTLAGVPPGNYDGIRFDVGLEPTINHGDVAQWPANHPLNPDVNHLYWGWSKEYVFLALEGRWRDRGKENGFSYHLATDRLLTTVGLATSIDLHSDREMQISLDVAKILSASHLDDSTDTTHSRTNDLLAVRLRKNVENAFVVVGNEPLTRPGGSRPAEGRVRDILTAPHATPYRLTISAFAQQPNLPHDNPLTVQGVELGSRLFFDRRLSANNSESCATCHNPKRAFSQPRRVSRGADGEPGTRNAMPLENLAWKDSFFWDGRAATLREQVLQPIQNPIEMHESLTNLVAKLGGTVLRPVFPGVTGTGGTPVPPLANNYPALFEAAFGSPEITPDRIARALEQFLLVQVSFNSKYDRVMNGTAQFTRQEALGYQLFNTEYDPYHGQFGADCFHCHGGPLFQSRDFANNGLDSAPKDLGLYYVTKRNGDQGKFAVPSLRNVAVTGPYMHDGRFKTLDQVVEHYCTGMKRSATLDPNLAKHPDGGVPLSDTAKKALVAFLKTLADERFVTPPASPVVARK